MNATLVETLPLAQRLALSYTPRAAREPTLALLALDQRLASILRNGSEPIIAQMKLAWWRERLADNPTNWPEGEPLLALLQQWPGEVAPLGGLVDGWEMLLAEGFALEDMLGFAQGRASGWAELAAALGADRAGAQAAAMRWALADLALNLHDPAERQAASALAREQAGARNRLARPLRALAVLDALARRSLETRSEAGWESALGEGLLDSPRAALLALRVGMTGR